MPSSYRFPHLSEERKALCLQIKKVPPEFKKKKKMFTPPVSALLGRGGCFLPTEALAALSPGPPITWQCAPKPLHLQFAGKIPLPLRFPGARGVVWRLGVKSTPCFWSAG